MSTGGLRFLTNWLAALTLVLLAACSQGGGSSSGSGTKTNSGTTIVVDKSGNGDYTTIQAALNAATAGTTIHVNAGTYNEFITFPSSGSATGGYITLEGASGAILSGNNQNVSTQQALITITGKSYIKVNGLEICNLTTTGKVNGDPAAILVSGGGSYLELRNNNIHDITCSASKTAGGSAHGILIYGDSATPISHVTIAGNNIHNNVTGWSENCTLDGNVTDFEITNNTIHDNNNIGIDIAGHWGVAPSGSPDYARNGIISGNSIYNITAYNNPAYGTHQYGADGIYVDGGANIIIERNSVDNCDLGIEAASENSGYATENVWIRNNFISRSPIANISVGGYSATGVGTSNNIYIYNNTTYQSAGTELQFQYNAQNIYIKNNIFVQASGGSYIGDWGGGNATPVLDTNIYHGGSSSSAGAFTDAHPIFADPLLVSPYADLRLQSPSPAINAGIAISGTDWQGNPAGGSSDIAAAARIQGGAVDIGAHEAR